MYAPFSDTDELAQGDIVSAVVTAYIPASLPQLFLRLGPEAVADIQFRVGYFFGRFATDDEYMLTDEEKRLRLQ